VEYQDMPLVRSLARDASKNGNKFSALVLGVVKSKPFQMNQKIPDLGSKVQNNTSPAGTGGNKDKKGAN
jgi:hypothetical protein